MPTFPDRHYQPGCRKRSTILLRFAISILLVALYVVVPAQVAAASITTASVPPACTRHQVKSLYAKAFFTRKHLRVAVAQFGSTNESLLHEGTDIAKKLQRSLENHFRNNLNFSQNGLLTTDLEIVRLPCVITDHNHAYQIGRSMNALVIFWGEIYTADHNQSEHYISINIKGGNKDINVVNSQNSHFINQPNITMIPSDPQDTYQTSMTIIPWKGLHGDSETEVPVHGKGKRSQAIPLLLKTRHVKGLFDCVLATYALRVHRHGLAVRFLDSCQKTAAGTTNVQDLYRHGGESQIVVGQIDKGIENLEHAQRQCNINNVKCRYQTHYRLGWAYERLERHSDALAHYGKALYFARTKRNLWTEGAALNGIGRINAAQGDLKQGQEFCERAKQICQHSKAAVCLAESVSCLARISAQANDLITANEQYRQALLIIEKEGDIGREAIVMTALGQILLRQGRGKDAEEYFENARKFFSFVNDPKGLATALNGLAHLAEDSGNQPKAVELYREAHKQAAIAQDNRQTLELRSILDKLSSSSIQQSVRQ